MSTENLKYSALTEKVIGAFYDVANELGHGFLESVYQKALLVRLGELGIDAAAESPFRSGFTDSQWGISARTSSLKASCFWN